METSQYDFPTTIQFGWGIRKRLPEVLGSCERPLLVTDQGIVNLRWFPELLNLLIDKRCAVFSDIDGNPTSSQVAAGTEMAREHECDVIIAVGGGAATDVAKAIALMQHHPGKLFDYENGQRPIDQPIARLIALPTTAGTGSEVGRSAVISCDETHAKKIIFSQRLLPVHVLADPELTMSLPASITAATGIDALTHLIEAFLAKGSHPICDGIALEGVRLVSESLVTAVSAQRLGYPDTEEFRSARSKMLNASMMGAIAFQKGLGVTHSCAHALSAVSELHHGLGIGVMIPYAMNFNRIGGDDQFCRLANAAGVQGADGFLNWLQWLNTEIGIPKKLSMVGVKENQIDALVDYAYSDSCHQLNPRKVEPSDLRDLFMKAM